MTRYKALKDVPYWSIKAGEVYNSQQQGKLEYLILPFQPSFQPSVIITPILEAGIIEEYKPREPLTRENIKGGEKYIHITLDSYDLSSIQHPYDWDGGHIDQQLSRAPIFRLDEETIASDCYKAMCDFGFQWVKENYSKYH